MPVKPIPDGYHTVTPYLCLRDAGAAIDFYKRALGAEERCRMPGPGGQGVMHAEIKIGDSIVMMSDEMADCGYLSAQSIGNSPVTLHVFVADVDAAIAKAESHGAKVIMPATDMFWGDRYGRIQDPFGHLWSIATHIEDVPPEQMPERAQKAFAEMGA